MPNRPRSAVLASVLLLTACAEGPTDQSPIAAEAEALLEGARTVGITLKLAPADKATDVELRKWWEPKAPLLRRIPKKAAVVLGAAKPRRTASTEPYWYQVAHAGTWGWIRASELEEFHGAYPELSQVRRDALYLGRSAMGFSYWWSNARWQASGATIWPENNTGLCRGTCSRARGGCTHKATLSDGTEYGADCSGFVSTVWDFPDQDPDTNRANNGFQTSAYATDRRNHWATIDLDDALPGDAIVRYDTEAKAGHIVLVAEARDKNDWVKTYECEGCAAGCWPRRRRIRDADFSDTDVDWHAIRRHGWPAN